MIKQISRLGAYGIIFLEDKLLLTLKKSGPYKGQWGLPGGAIEFGETPEEALVREVLEETALKSSDLRLLTATSAKGRYEMDGEPYDFHQIGLIYKIGQTSPVLSRKPEEEIRLINPNQIPLTELTPFARHFIQSRSV